MSGGAVNAGAVNDGTIIGGGGGSGGSGGVSNAGDGSGGVGVLLPAGGTFTDAGSVGGGSGADGIADALYFGTGASRLILDPGAAFLGAVVANAAYSNVLELAPGSSSGTLVGLGTQFTGFGRGTIDATAVWTLADANTIETGVTLNNSGTLTDTGTLTNNGRLTGGLSLAAGAALYNAGGSTITHGGSDAVTGVGGPGLVVNDGFIGGTVAGALGLLLAKGGTSPTSRTARSTATPHLRPGRRAHADQRRPDDSDAATAAGIKLAGGGSVTNQMGGVISGYRGVYAGRVAATVVNAGLISGNATSGAGAKSTRAAWSPTRLAARSAASAGSRPRHRRCDGRGQPGGHTGGGTSGDYGVFLRRGGFVTNQTSGTVTGSISGYRGIFSQVVAATVLNQGIVSGGTTAGGAVSGWSKAARSPTSQVERLAAGSASG